VGFSDLNASYCDLRDGLRAQVSGQAMGDVNIRPPSGDSDEGSFLRLTGWCFALLFEAGRVVLPFLLALPSPSTGAVGQEAQSHRSTRELVQKLRTILSHNIGFEEGHELGIRRAVSQWFVETCHEVSPTSPVAWQACFQRLSADVRDLLLYCNSILSAIASSSSEDRALVLEDLRSRLARDWQAHEFDPLIEDAAARLGEKIDARAFREVRVANWRRFLAALPVSASPKLEMERVIDGEVAEHFRHMLPVRTTEIMSALHLEPGPSVKRAVELARQIFASGVRNREELLGRLVAQFTLE
jgi:hypothetical protein